MRLFLKFLKYTALTLFLGGVLIFALNFFAKPGEKELALVPIAMDTNLKTGAGFITNATGYPWAVYIRSYDKITGDSKLSRVWVTTDPLQAVVYALPDVENPTPASIEIVILYAKKLAKTQERDLIGAGPSSPF